ncbi:MAG TPA: GH1 family beta-glucosidase [Spirochaetia bacterium]|nr:GH1 family beta-glucosidase [Spirochaetia bacterium]
MSDNAFPAGFLWGTATAAYQIEGAAREDGKGESIWDRFCRKPGAILDGGTGDVACDHYHRWRDDVENMRDLGLNAYRFSVSWPRVLPSGSGKVNESGLAFYETLVDALLRERIEPAVTLYHWDLPQALQDKGGWTNRDTALRFADYAEKLYLRLGDRVKTWITLNEPQVCAFAGYGDGVHAPGIRDLGQAVQATHVLNVAHALAVEAYREESPGAHRIGITLDLHPIYPWTDGASDAEAARVADGRINRWFLDPVLKGSYPRDIMTLFEAAKVAPHVSSGDLRLLASHPGDFLGVNYYFPLRALASDADKVLHYECAVHKERDRTEMGWEIYPEGLYDLLLRLRQDYGDRPIMITENGAAFPDRVIERGQVQDADRINYIRAHLEQALRAIRAGVKLEGYYLWTLLDNFEWAFGFTKKFGITSFDRHTHARTWKKSASWYQSVVATNGRAL